MLVITKFLTPNAIRICDKMNNVTLVYSGDGDDKDKTIIRINGIKTQHHTMWWSLDDFINGVLK